MLFADTTMYKHTINRADFRFYEELNDFLSKSKRKTVFSVTFKGNPAIKDTIESIGVPHTEVDLILVNSSPVDFSYQLKNGDRVSVYPVFESLDISGATHLRAKPLRETKFILDVHLGKLAGYLRMLGYDTLYRNDYHDSRIVSIAVAEKRIILTRDIGMLKIKEVTHGYWVRSSRVKEQLVEFLRRFDLKNQIREFSRCIECNQILNPVSKNEIIDELPAKVARLQNEFYLCPSCKGLFWKGTHYQKMLSFIQSVRNSEF